MFDDDAKVNSLELTFTYYYYTRNSTDISRSQRFRERNLLNQGYNLLERGTYRWSGSRRNSGCWILKMFLDVVCGFNKMNWNTLRRLLVDLLNQR